MQHLDPGRAGAVEQDSAHQRPALDGEVWAAHSGVEVGTRRALPPSVDDVLIERAEPLLTEPVHVVGSLVTGLFRGREKGAKQRALGAPASDLQWP